jgi:hypothetical protein
MFIRFPICFTFVFWCSCRHHVAIESAPYGADVSWKEDTIGKTPMEYTFWWYPGRKIPLTVQYFGYRSTVLDVHRSISPLIIADDIIHFRWKQLVGTATRTTNTAVLVPEHGPAGTWSPEDAQSFQ